MAGGHRFGRFVAVLGLFICQVAMAAQQDDAPSASPNQASAGLRLYRDGLLPGGARLSGLGAGAATVTTPCAGCHRDSGMGGGEGNQRVAPITAADLFQAPAGLARPAAGDRLPRERSGATVQPGRRLSRPGYDLKTLARALRTGVDAAGRPLDALMPRYTQLDDAAVQTLADHLATLHTDAAPGWTQAGAGATQGELHLTTIVTPDAAPLRVRALLESLHAWQAQHQSPRVRLRPVLQVWRLEGAPADWPAQLATWQARQPVFAVLSGAAGASSESWRPVQDWCEREALPCLLPLVDTPPEDAAAAPPARWTLHGSTGSRMEAQALAVLLRQSPVNGRLTQWFDDTTGARAAGLLEAALTRPDDHDHDHDNDNDNDNDNDQDQDHHDHAVEGRAAGQTEPVDAAAALARWCTLGEADTLVIWSGPAVLAALDQALDQAPATPVTPTTADCTGPGRVYLSASRLGHRPPRAPAWQHRARLVSTEVDDQRLHARTAIALQPWARRSGLDLFDEREQAKVHAATSWFTEALARMQGRVGRDYLMESLERTLDNRALAGPWLSVSLGPGQRTAVKSAQILHLDGSAASRRWRAHGQAIRP
ncbi:cytochrome c [Sphaerotilus mobilis]|uniref:cytochrome c n=1 Tax=Sphaerotilus mobilis TaxID=47994 RepID=UPI0013EE9EDC|nr:cytochrome c [Sphaerotilus mobilis]